VGTKFDIYVFIKGFPDAYSRAASHRSVGCMSEISSSNRSGSNGIADKMLKVTLNDNNHNL